MRKVNLLGTEVDRKSEKLLVLCEWSPIGWYIIVLGLEPCQQIKQFERIKYASHAAANATYELLQLFLLG